MGKIFEGEMLIRTILLSIFCKIYHSYSFQVIVKSIIDPEDNFESYKC